MDILDAIKEEILQLRERKMSAFSTTAHYSGRTEALDEVLDIIYGYQHTEAEEKSSRLSSQSRSGNLPQQ